PGLGTHAYHLRFSPDGQFLAAIYHQQQPALFVWDWRRGQAVLKTGLFGGTDFSPDSRRLVLGDQGSIRFYDLASGKEEKRLALGPGGHQFAFDPKGRRLAVTGGSQANVQIYDLPTDKIVQTLTCPADAGAMSWRSDGEFLAATGNDGCLYVWSTRTGKQQA